MRIYRKFIKGVPEYLARYYWWAYLWRGSIWFFDHQWVINLILLGQYERLLTRTLAQVERNPAAKLLQLTCVYGTLTPRLLSCTANPLQVCDTAAGQLQLTRRKTGHVANQCQLARMNTEHLAYRNDAFDQVIVFFLFHEMPARVRINTYHEIARVVRPGGSVLVTEFAATPNRHWLYRLPPYRWLSGYFEPFLADFCRENLAEKLGDALKHHGKVLGGEPAIEHCFDGFYRIMRFSVNTKSGNIDEMHPPFFMD
jgi:ubiquinone/menaquinone biosynthesis C-methylase UbiE